MRSSRWQQVERLYHAALKLEENERAAFLDEACGEDSELRREIESLLRYEPRAQGFIGKPAVELAAADIARDSATSLIGREIGSYRVLSRIGKGGMGEVWKARDTRLGREVAIKSLPEEFSGDEERLARFEREAKLLASLNHPNIGAIYGIEEQDDTRFLILELVEGETLAERLKRGPIPIEESLELALQIAEGLEAAHEKGVVHRDLKPANIKVTTDGKVKVLDFGLAKPVERDPNSGGDSSAPTLSVEETKDGVILGTAAYMSPEQAKGEAVNRATDIWAFGCVLYEMLTGQRAFRAVGVSELIAAVIRAEPEWNALPTNIHPRLREALQRCLQKASRNRWHDIADVRLDIETTLADSTGAADEPAEATRTWGGFRPAVPWMLASALLTAGVVSLGIWGRIPLSPPQTGLRFTISPPPNERWVSFNGMGVSMAPDGQDVAFLAGDEEGTSRLYLRSMNGLESRRVPDSDGAYHPFFSPDSRQLGFFAAGRLWRVPVEAGSPIEVGRVDATARGATWAPDGYIYFGGSTGISRIAVSEGTPELLTSVDQDGGVGGHRWPEVLPGGKALLFTVFRGELDSNRVALLSLETNDWRVLIQETGHHARYAGTGHIVYMRGDVMMAAPFDLDLLELAGPPEPILDGIAVNDGGAAHFGFSENGTLVFVPGGPPGTFTFSSSMVWTDRQGNEEALQAPDGAYLNPVISHGGTRVAVELFDERGQSDIGIWDLERDTLTRLISDPAADAAAVWMPDDARIIFNSHRDGRVSTLFSKRADGVGPAEPVTASSFPAPVTASSRGQVPSAMSADGQTLLFAETNTREHDVYSLSMTTGASELLLRRAFSPKISPDGKWVAYEFQESGGPEIYVSPFPDVDSGRWKVSTAGGAKPVWSRDGSELFYREVAQMMAVSIQVRETFEAGIPRALFSVTSFLSFSGFDVSADGRFLMLNLVDSTDADRPDRQIHVVTNWFEELRALAPVP